MTNWLATPSARIDGLIQYRPPTISMKIASLGKKYINLDHSHVAFMIVWYRPLTSRNKLNSPLFMIPVRLLPSSTTLVLQAGYPGKELGRLTWVKDLVCWSMVDMSEVKAKAISYSQDYESDSHTRFFTPPKFTLIGCINMTKVCKPGSSRIPIASLSDVNVYNI